MDIVPIEVQLTCLFCDAVLTGKTDIKPVSGDLITCPACGKGNDYDSVLEVAKQKGLENTKSRIAQALWLFRQRITYKTYLPPPPVSRWSKAAVWAWAYCSISRILLLPVSATYRLVPSVVMP